MLRHYQVTRDRRGAPDARWLVVDIRERERFGRKAVAEQFASREKARARARQLNAEVAATLAAGGNAQLHTQ